MIEDTHEKSKLNATRSTFRFLAFREGKSRVLAASWITLPKVLLISGSKVMKLFRDQKAFDGGAGAK